MRKNKINNKRKKYSDLFWYWLILALIGFLRLWPLSFDCRLGEMLAIIWFYLDRGHRLITLQNIERAFGSSLSERERLSLAKKIYLNFGRIVMEFVYVPCFTTQNICHYVSIKGLENLYEAEKQEKGVLFLTAHFANWELLAVSLALYGFPTTGVVRPLDNPYLDRLVKHYRTKCGNKIIAKKGAVKKILKYLQEKGRVGILMDQNASTREGVFVDFFGILASTPPILAALSQKTGAPVLPIFLLPRENGKGYVIDIAKQVELINTGDKEKDIILNTAKFTRIIEENIRSYPHCWFWMHRRWKTRPEDQLRKWAKIRKVITS